MPAHTREAVATPSKRRADLLADLEAVVLRCLAKVPTGRFPDALGLKAALQSCRSAGE
ncbi:hypothetical protein [Paludisphaera mucosa]|uniref:Uncharacterized protein n=1 Tax=Paludisphaera mucosa TaxID=3030827 RepID=A0ABT6F3T4_9BACT|nr:hypothetical protein [Paludisphaera mucosa]MDG3002243.1 hypothetical protein [Paludisphaera mucosa]